MLSRTHLLSSLRERHLLLQLCRQFSHPRLQRPRDLLCLCCRRSVPSGIREPLSQRRRFRGRRLRIIQGPCSLGLCRCEPGLCLCAALRMLCQLSKHLGVGLLQRRQLSGRGFGGRQPLPEGRLPVGLQRNLCLESLGPLVGLLLHLGRLSLGRRRHLCQLARCSRGLLRRRRQAAPQRLHLHLHTRE